VTHTQPILNPHPTSHKHTIIIQSLTYTILYVTICNIKKGYQTGNANKRHSPALNREPQPASRPKKESTDMKTASTRTTSIRSRLSEGITLISIRAPSPNTVLLALILGPATLMALRSI